ncbi:MAG: LPS assembly lipoprotein LptE [Gammaproteobacteria bacterium]|nr:LPS assembly lipoprotein LptE [Gammaproteobacteria bacterium]
MKILHPVFSLALLALAAGQLGGCGFQLRGDATLPAEIRSVHVNAPAGLKEELQIYLEGAGVDLASSRSGADASINVTREFFDRRVLSVDPNTGKEREFELAYTVDFNVVRGNGAPLMDAQSINLLRDYVFDPASIIGKSREEHVLQDEMRRDAAQQLLRRMQAGLSK